VRRPASVAERRLAEYNLNVINFGMLTGRQEIWGRQDPPDPQLAMLGVLGDARDAACAFRFPIAADGIVPGFRVRRGHFGQADAYPADGKAIKLGKVAGTNRDIAVPLRSDADDYRKLADEPGFDALEVITVGDEGGAPLRFNPFEVPTGVLVGEHTANLLACFKAAFGLFGPLPSIYQDALNLTYLRAGFLSAERSTGIKRTWPTVVEFLAAMSEVTTGLGFAGDVKANIDAASIRRARQLVRGIAGSAFMTDRPSDIGRLLDHPVILELKSLGTGDEQVLMMALLLNAVTEHFQSARGASADLVHVTLVEEAHRLLARSAGGKSAEDALAKERAAEAFANTLAENRKYGEGVIIAEQLPAKLVADAVKNTNLKIMHRLIAEDDRRYLGETMGVDEAQRLIAARLQTGEALLYSDEFAEAAHVNIVRTLRADAPRPGVVQPGAVPPFAACYRCRAQCGYRGAALSMVNDPRIVTDVTDAAVAVARAGGTPAEQRAGLAELRGRLYETVGRFAALPTSDPGRSDAAFCLFLHVYASSGLRVMPAWPAIAARFLEITAPGGEIAGETVEKAESAGDGDSLLRAAGDIAALAGRAGGDALRAAEDRDGGRTDQSPATGEGQAHDLHGR
jgi:hypothetical protein